MIAILRDGRKLVGILRSYDQYANLVMQDCVERVYAGHMYADIPRGIFLIRGDNLVFLGGLEENERPSQLKHNVKQVEIEHVLLHQHAELDKRERLNRLRTKVLSERGFGEEMESEAY